jgi:hypothetical protein
VLEKKCRKSVAIVGLWQQPCQRQGEEINKKVVERVGICANRKKLRLVSSLIISSVWQELSLLHVRTSGCLLPA